MIRTEIELTDEQAAAIHQLANEWQIPDEQVIVQGIETILRQSEWKGDLRHDLQENGATIPPLRIRPCPPPTLEQRDRARHAVGIFRSGLGDVSINHDDYLDDSYDPR